MKALRYLLVAVGVPAFAGPWIPEPGSGSVFLGASILKASRISDRQGDPRDYGITESGLNLQTEYGIFPGASVSLAWTPIKAIGSDSVDRIRFTDIEWGLSLKVARLGNHRFAVRTAARIPLGGANKGTPDFLYALHSQNNWAVELQPQWGWAGRGAWLQASGGMRLRSSGFSAQGLYAFSGGKSFGLWGPRFGFSGLLPLDTRSNGKPSDQEKFYGWQVAVDRRLGKAYKLGIQFDSMLTPGQELPLGLRSNLYLGYKW